MSSMETPLTIEVILGLLTGVTCQTITRLGVRQYPAYAILATIPNSSAMILGRQSLHKFLCRPPDSPGNPGLGVALTCA
jgi:hypothetical protein